MFIIGIILIFTGVYNRLPQKSEACTMAWPIVKIAVIRNKVLPEVTSCSLCGTQEVYCKSFF